VNICSSYISNTFWIRFGVPVILCLVKTFNQASTKITVLNPNQFKIMKKTKLLIIVLIFMPALWYGCSKTDDGSYTAPITVYEKVNGTWNMFSIKMIDETAKSAAIKPDEVTLTDQFSFAGFAITLNADEANNPTTYTVTGEAPQLLAPQGFWDLDTKFPQTDGTPVKINLFADAAKTQKTNQLSITTMPGALPEMEFKLTHSTNKVAFVSYQYKLALATTK
jgi:hypothetical protein